MAPSNPNEELFELYLTHHGIDFKFEPDLPTTKKPDYRIWRNEAEPAIVEVEGFSARKRPPLPAQHVSAPSVKPLRHAIKEAAGQLRDLRGRGLPLVVALGNAEGAGLDLTGDDLIEAIEGNPRVVMLINQETGASEHEYYDPRDGKARDHQYLSAVLAFYRHPADQGHPTEDFVPFMADAITNKTARPCVDLIRFPREQAVPLPDIFQGEHDRIWDFDGADFDRVR